MFCPKCGADNPEEARFCGKCAAAMPGPAAPAVTAGTTAHPTVSSGLKTGIGICSVLLPIVGLIMGIMYMVDASPEKKAVGKLWLLLACGGMAMYCAISVANMH